MLCTPAVSGDVARTLVASFDRLSAEARLVAQIGAVLERDFREQLVEQLAGDAVVDVHGALSELEDAGSWTLRLASDLVELTCGTDPAPDGPALLDRAIAAIAGGDDTADVTRAKEIVRTATARWMGT